jgi:hypothetical protein
MEAAARTDGLISYLLATGPSSRAPPDESGAALAAAAVSAALVLASDGTALASSSHARVSNNHHNSPRVARGAAGKPKKRSAMISSPRVPSVAQQSLIEPILGRDSDHESWSFIDAKKQLVDSAVLQCNRRFNAFADVDIITSPRLRKGVPPHCSLSPRAFYSAGLSRPRRLEPMPTAVTRKYYGGLA